MKNCTSLHVGSCFPGVGRSSNLSALVAHVHDGRARTFTRLSGRGSSLAVAGSSLSFPQLGRLERETRPPEP